MVKNTQVFVCLGLPLRPHATSWYYCVELRFADELPGNLQWVKHSGNLYAKL